jgi:hypothetical protein
LNHLERQDRAVLFFVRFISELGLNESGIDQKCEPLLPLLRDGSLGQHSGLSGHLPQSRLLARYRSMIPSFTNVPVVVSVLPAGQW